MKNASFTKESLIPSIVLKRICNWIYARICPNPAGKVTNFDRVLKLELEAIFVSATKIDEITANNLICYFF